MFSISSKIHIESLKSDESKSSSNFDKSNAITRRLGLPCIILEKDSHIMHPKIVEKGTVGNYQKMKLNYQKVKKNDTKIN